MHLLAAVNLVVAVIAVLVLLVTNEPKTQNAALLTMAVTLVVMAVLFFIMPAPVHAADLKPVMFPASEARLIEQELVNAHIRRQTLPSVKTDIYRCEDYDRKIERLVEIYDQLNRTEMARQWRLHLGHVWEFSLNFCEDIRRHDRYQVAYRLYRDAVDKMRAQRVATKEARRLRLLEKSGRCDEMGNCRSALVTKIVVWERLAIE